MVALVRIKVRAASGRHALATGRLDVEIDILPIARVLLWIDEDEIPLGPDGEAEFFEPGLDHGGTAYEDRLCKPLLQRHLRGAQHALVLALRIGDAFRIGLRLGEQRPHDEAGAEHEGVEALAVLRR